MADIVTCPDPRWYKSQDSFKELRKQDAYKDYTDEHIINALTCFVRHHPKYGEGFIPVSPTDRAVFTRYIRYQFSKDDMSEVDTKMTRDTVLKGYDTLYHAFTPEQLSSRIDMIARDFDGIVTQLTQRDSTHRSRVELIKAYGDDDMNGYQRLMNVIFDHYAERAKARQAKIEALKASPEVDTKLIEQEEYVYQEYETMLLFKERLAALAANKIGGTEGFIVKLNDDMTVSLSTVSEEQLAEERDSSGQEDGTDPDDGQKGERYVDFRTFKLMETLGPRARRLISRIPRTNAKGEIIRDDINQKKFLDQRQVAVTLSRIFRYSTPLTFMDDLRDSQDAYPWLKDLITKLEQDHEARTTVYTAFKKAGNLFIYTVRDGGTYLSKVANSRAQGRSAMLEAGNNLRSGWVIDEDGYSIYNDNGTLRSIDKLQELKKNFEEIKERVVNGTAFIRMVKGDQPISKSSVEYERIAGPDSMKAYLALPENKELPNILSHYLRGLGFAFSPQDVIDASELEMSEKTFLYYGGDEAYYKQSIGRNRLYWLVKDIDSALNQAILTAREKGPEERTGFTFYTSSQDELSGITDILALTKYDEIEERFLNDGKSMTALQNPNLLTDIMDGLTNKSGMSEEEYQDYLEQNYLQYEGMTYTDEIQADETINREEVQLAINELGGEAVPQIYSFNKVSRATGWLKWLKEGKYVGANREYDIRKIMRVATTTGFNHKDYARLTRNQKITSSLLTYASSGRLFAKGTDTEPFALYEIPIQGDYGSAYQFIYAPKLTNKEIFEELVNEVRCELERIRSIEERIKLDPDGKNRPKLATYEREGVKFQIFPEFNTNGFRQTYTSLSANEAEAFLRQSIIDQMTKIKERDKAVINESGVLKNTRLAAYGLYTESGLIEKLSDAKQKELANFFYNDFYARLQVVKIFDGGLWQFNGIVDFEKRNMLLHAPRSPLYTEAEWNGEKVGRENQYSVYLGDEVSASTAYKGIVAALDELLAKHFITKRQYKSMCDAYSKITSTDGAGFRTLDSYRAVRIMSDNWDERHEKAYKRIAAGKPTKGDIDLFMEGLKLVTTGTEHIQQAAGDYQKPVKLTVLHKYSEQVLLPLALAQYCLGAQSAPLRAMNLIADRMKAQGKTIDLFVFKSGVKVGGHSIINPFTRWGDLTDEQRKERGYAGQGLDQRILSTAEEMADYVVSSIEEKPWSIHVTPFKYTGVAASTTPHGMEDSIAQSSQLEKSIWADLMPYDEVVFNGEKMTAFEARKLYYDIKTSEIVKAFEEIRKFFKSEKELARVLEEELATKSYYSTELPYAIKALKGGEFMLPLFSPGIEHPVQQLLASIIKKRMTKIRGKGSNLMVASGLGVEMDVSAYTGNGVFPEEYRLGVTFDKNGGAWFDAAVPLPDSWKEFANEDGVITPQMLWGYDDEKGEHVKGLVDKGIIPESALECLAARNPADYTHSAIPTRIKWFRANVEGAGAIIAKEAMVTTGQDFDGDKLRFNFKEWDVVWNEDKIKKHFEAISGKNVDSDVELLLNILGQSNSLRDYKSFSDFIKSDANPLKEEYRMVKPVEYKFNKDANGHIVDKSVFNNSDRAKHNAKLDLMLSQLTSRAGTIRMLIAGGCEDTKVYTKSIYLLKNFRNQALNQQLKAVMKADKKKGGLGLNSEMVDDMFSDSVKYYNGLCKLDDGQLSTLMRVATSADSPYSFAHSIDAFETIVGGKEMISVYAVYNSTSQLLQRLNLKYRPAKTKKGTVMNIHLLGRDIGDLFNVTTNNVKEEDRVLASLAFAHLVNAAVDNNKDPLLGLINQTKELAPMTCFLSAAGYTEEEIHLLMNQPVILALGEEMKGKSPDKMQSVIMNLQAAICKEYNIQSYNWFNSYKDIKNLTKNRLIESLQLDLDNLPDIEVEQQLTVLYLFSHLTPAANLLSEFIKLVRPETNSGSIGATIANIINKKNRIDKFRAKLAMAGDDIRIDGMNGIINHRNVEDGWVSEKSFDEVNSNLREVTALTSLMIDSSLDMFSYYFPQAKEDWYPKIMDIANMYDYESMPDSLMEKIGNELILWKLLQDSDFVRGDTQEEQRRVLIEVPYQLKQLKKRIDDAKDNPGEDKAADLLQGNIFLDNLGVSDPTNTQNPRLRFNLNGPAIENMADTIRYDWNALLRSPDDGIRQLAIDLFLYNMYTNGFGYGMYEFSHFAPMSVIVRTPHYIDTLYKVLRSSKWEFKSDEDNEFLQFKHQYVRNHWGDDRFLPRVWAQELPNEARALFGYKPLSEEEAKSAKRDNKFGYVIVMQKDANGNTVETLLEYTKKGPRVAVKLGVRLKNGQATLNYNPRMADYHDVHPVTTGNESSWGVISGVAPSIEDASAQANYEDDSGADKRVIPEDDNARYFMRVFGRAPVNSAAVQTTASLNDASDVATKANVAALKAIDVLSEDNETKTWAKSAPNGYEVSTAGDRIYSALYATFKPGTVIFGHDVGGRTIESVYQHGVKQADWGTIDPIGVKNSTGAPRSIAIITGNTPDDSYYQGYLPLWQEWARQNPGLIARLRNLSKGKVLTDQFTRSDTTVSQARALADILNSSNTSAQVNVAALKQSNDEQAQGAAFAAMANNAINAGEQPAPPIDFDQMLSIAKVDEDGKVIIDKVKASPNNIRLARRQKVQSELNASLRDIMRKKGVSTGVLTEQEARLRINGVTDFDTAEVLANGLVELIRLREGYRGEEALPEEFAHLALAMLGTDNALVNRLLSVLSENQQALEEAFEGQYEEYEKAYSGDREKLILEAAGKLVAKQLLYQQEIKTYPIRGLIRRIIDAIKDFFKRFSKDEIQKAIFDANRVANGLARELLGGRILDDRTIQDIKTHGKLIQSSKKILNDLSKKEDILNEILKTEMKKLRLLQTRVGYNKAAMQSDARIGATKDEIASLKRSIDEHKVESTIIGYMNRGLDFIMKSNLILEDKVNNQLPANQVCSSLSMTRDILLSYTSVIQSVRDAIVKGEIADSKAIQDAISQLEGELGKYYTYYNRIGMRYLSEMLSGVYGKDGLIVNIGKDKGRHITIKEMAEMSDRDISFMSRWFHSVADNNDYVLKAMDSMVRNAKEDAYQQTLMIQAKLVAALDKLERETGSKDQRFMFAYDEAGHKTGKYITITDSMLLSAPQKDFYDTIMALKKEIDRLVPEEFIQDLKIVMLRKRGNEKIREAEGLKNKTREWIEAERNRVLDMSDDIDFDEYKINVDFSNSKVDMLPLKYLAKGKNETYDDMTDDVASSILAYAGMANEYDALNSIIGILENAKYMASRRDIGQKVGIRTMMEEISTEDDTYKRPFKVKQARTKIQELMEDFFQMQLYGHLQSNEGTIGHTRISKRKLVNLISRITSMSQMAMNLPQRVANVTVGGSQVLVQAAGGSSYNLKNVTKATGIWLKESGDRLAETGKNDPDNKLSLWMNYFDFHQSNKGEFENVGLGRSRGSKVFNTHLLFAGLTVGEDYLGAITALSLAMNTPVIDAEGNPSNMWDAYTVKYIDPEHKSGAYLALKDGYRKADGSPITKEDERNFSHSAIGTNFDLQGIYNQNDRSAVQQYWFGALIIMYRKWIAPALKRRYGSTQYNTLQGDFQQGYYTTLGLALLNAFNDAKDAVSEDESLNTIERIGATIRAMWDAYHLNLDKMTDYERSNLKKAWTELCIVLGLFLSTSLLLRLPPDEHDDDFIGWAENFGLAQLLRLRTELGAQAPTHLLVQEGWRILRSPFAAIGPIASFLNAGQLLLPHNYITKIRSGRYKGHSRAYKYFREFPMISMFKKVENAIDPSPMLQYYKNDSMLWTPDQ